ncbi:MAG: hypothetical protein VYC39_10715 [Myxococcota bacterium]|nr:hypothetical protein [Myxococcota bacterium]
MKHHSSVKYRKFSRLFFLIGMFCSLSFGCGGVEGQADLPEPVLEQIQTVIFEPACATSGCHDSGCTDCGNLDMSSAQLSFENMVEKPVANGIAKMNGWVNVKPGDPDRSFLIRKLRGPGVGEGDAMPSNSETLNEAYIKILEEWITNGAAR